jgi:toxin ParE1/3/4
MKYLLDIQPSAEEGSLEGFKYYESKREGLGQEFLDQIEEQIKQLQKAPTLYQVKHNNLRTVLIERFPYHIVYEIHEITIVVYKIVFARRHSNKRYTKK